MKVIKSFAAKDINIEKLSDIFDSVLKNIPTVHSLDVIEFHVRDNNHTIVHDEKGIISVNYYDPFIRDGDEKGMRALLIHSLYHIITGKRYGLEMPHFIADILINRQMILDGYADDVLYVSYIYLLGKKDVNFQGFLAANVPWLSFYGLDNYNSDMLNDMVKKIKYDKSYNNKVTRLIESLKKDITDEKNLAHSVHLYEVMLCK